MIRFTGLGVRRGPQLLFDAANAEIYPEQKVGLTGANGCGKSSLFAVILGQLEADAGDCSMPADWVIAHVAQSVPSGAMSAHQFVLEGDEPLAQINQQIEQAQAEQDGDALGRLYQSLDEIDGYSAPSRASLLLAGLGFSNEQMQQTVDSLSGGWRMRLNLGRALMCRSDVLLLDEPTNHLDLDAIIWLQSWLERYQGTAMMISHDRDFLDAVVTQVLHIEQGGMRAYKGNYSQFERQRAANLALQGVAYAKQQKEIAEIEAFVTRFKAKATKAKQAQSRVKTLEKMQLIAPAHSESPFKFKFIAADKTPDSLLEIVDAAAGYDEQPVLEQINLGILAGDRIGLIGANGAGKSTLIKLIAGALTPQIGHITRSKHLKVGYFAQHQLDQFDGNQTPFNYLHEQQPTFREQEIYDHLGGFAFKKARVDEPVGHFSGGEKARLALALLVAQRPNLLLLDEPTNHLDLQMRHALTVALQDFDGAMVVVSHDRFLLRSVADQLVLVGNRQAAMFEGDLKDYGQHVLSTRQDSETVSLERPAVDNLTHANKKDQRKQRAEQRLMLKPLMQQVKKHEQYLEKTAQAQQQLEKQLMDESLYETANKAQLTALLKQKGEADRAHQQAEQAWLESADALEQAQAV